MKVLLNTILAVALMSLSALGSTAELRSPVPLSKDPILNAAVKDVLKSPKLGSVASKAICICGGDGEGGWSCTPKGCDGGRSNVGGTQIKNLLSSRTGTLTADAICICAFEPSTGVWTCNPPGCWVSLDQASAPVGRSIDTRTTPAPRTMPAPR